MARALVLGVNGQDGSYLAESLLRRGHDVYGLGRDPSSRHVKPQPGFFYRQVDLSTTAALQVILIEVEPDVAFHFAAVHGAVGAGFTYEAAWRDMMQVNVFALHVLLEHARLTAPTMRIIYAGSAKVLAFPLSGIIDEFSVKQPSCLYGIGKLTARDLLVQYRRDHGIQGTNLILFNHDSARRPGEFFLPRLASAVLAARRDKNFRTEVRTLAFRIDWSAADEIMDMVVELFERGPPPELVVASGRTIHARDFVDQLFKSHGVMAAAHLGEIDPAGDSGPLFHVNIDRFAAACGRRPLKSAFDIVADIMQAMTAAPPPLLGATG